MMSFLDKNVNALLNLAKEIKILKTSKDFVEEGYINKNCVVSYIKDVNNEKCLVLSLRKTDKRYTIEIRKRGKKFYLA